MSLCEWIWEWHQKGHSCFVPVVWESSPYHHGIVQATVTTGLGLSWAGHRSPEKRLTFLHSCCLCGTTLRPSRCGRCQKWTNSLCLLVMRNANGSRKLQIRLFCLSFRNGLLLSRKTFHLRFDLVGDCSSPCPPFLREHSQAQTWCSVVANSAAPPHLPQLIV